jgi:hypothetical protein
MSAVRKPRYHYLTSLLMVLLLAGFGPCPAWADFITYNVSVNTSAISGQQGNLDFQFNPGGSGAMAATVMVTGYQGVGGILAPSATLTGDAAGLLPSTLTLDNGTAFNDVFQGFTYGSNFSFQLRLSGPAVGGSGGVFGSSFALSLYDAAGINPLLTTDPNGSVLTVNLNTNGTASVQSFPQSPTDNTPIATASPAVTASPEPGSMVLLISTAPVVVGVWLRKRRRLPRARAVLDAGQV